MKKGIVFLSALFLGAIGINVSSREPLTFQERVKAQEAIERVYYNHRIWPKENPEPKPPFEKMVSKEVIEAKVTDYLKKCVALDQFWQRPIIASQLQAEMDRMAKGSKDPATLNELFAALDNDPYLIAECLARPVLADRLIHNWYANDERCYREMEEKEEEEIIPEDLKYESYSLPPMPEYSCDGTWIPTSLTNAPDARGYHTAIWTGIEMIIWGGWPDVNSGGKYYPSTDTWAATSTSTNCPAGRYEHTAIWTGTEMIVWGGGNYYNTGGRYNPVADTWLSTSTSANCPSGRRLHSVVWTGSKMIIWGGAIYMNVYTNSGGCYNPVADEWSPISTTDAPDARGFHTSVWTGTEMIVWGGYSSTSGTFNTGGRYNPSADTWTTTSTGTDCPSARHLHSAVWAGSEMIVWGGIGGGSYFYSGGIYNPSNDSWTATSTGTNCPAARIYYSTVWTGNEMIVWGGYRYYSEFDIYVDCNNGGKYDPTNNVWTATSAGSNCPTGRLAHSAIWTGSKMIVWGGEYHDTCCLSSTEPLQSGGSIDILYSPSGFSNNIAGDDSGCSDSGVWIDWSAPSYWCDGGSGSRTFDILRDGTPIATGLSESTLSYTDTTGDNGVTYLYQVRANNGCGLSTTTTGVSAADNIGTSPDEVSNFDDVYSWDAVSDADGYRLYRGTLADLPSLMSTAADGCVRYEGTATSYDLSGDDPSGATGGLYWYLVTAYTGACEGTAGEGTGFLRNLSSSTTCP